MTLALWNYKNDKVGLDLCIRKDSRPEHPMIFSISQVIVATYKIATVLEVEIDSDLRNKRIKNSLTKITNLLNHDEKNDTNHNDDKHTKKEKKKKKKRSKT